MAIDKNYGDTNFITGMRAFAALGVLLIHAGSGGLEAFGTFGIRLSEFGRTGVFAFFVISGYSISASYDQSENYLQYLNRRLWRIAPIYYFWLAVALLAGFAPFANNAGGLTTIDALNIWLHVAFLSFIDYKITNSILGVEWSISIEVFWYILAPLLLFFIRGRVMVAMAIAVSVCCYWLIRQFPTLLPWPADNLGLAVHWSPFPYLVCYCLGVGAYRLRQSMPGLQRYGNAAFASVIVLIVLFLAYREKMLKLVYDEVLFASVVTAALIVFGSKSSIAYRWFFSNRLAVFLGTISYGIYLPQFLLLLVLRWYLPPSGFMVFASACVLSVAVSYVFYRLIELPALAFGTSLGNRFFAKRRLRTIQ